MEQIIIEDEEECEESGYCSHCNGSGEGSYSGSSCRNCKGSGEVTND